ncbi:hypothetical protein ACFO5R_16805 [Halosolutus amylolyticus]|uniref:Uncharacterized protein n=1 Tax=Halosolutus amylolyticus TaxID=2932267 RepID=A0ABD5PSM3_9EURY|nr:hypothetical protein [Halosolutus amylolyticus]
MDRRTTSGLLATLTVVCLAIVGVYGFVSSYLLGSPGEWLVPTVATLAVTVVFVGALAATGARSKRWRENPYW